VDILKENRACDIDFEDDALEGVPDTGFVYL